MDLRKPINSLIHAFTFLTVLPLGKLAHDDHLSPGKMFSYFPVVGLVIGICVAVIASIEVLPRDLTAFVALCVWVALTGGLHLDGLADSCDGLLATVSAERRLEIMKDPRAGSWAVVGVVLMLLGKWIALRTLSPLVLVIPPLLGRWAMVLAVAAFPSARATGLGAAFQIGLGRRQVITATVFTVSIMLTIGGFVTLNTGMGWRMVGTIGLLLVPPAVVYGFGKWAAQRLGGGLTGDIYGALCEGVELLCLLCLNIS